MDEQPDFTWKVVLVGNKMVGKTSISNRFVENTFDETYKTSTEVKYKRKNVPIAGTQNIAQLHLWDTLGQERFKALAPIFFRRSIAAFLVYDVCDRDSFLALETWNQQIKDNSDEDIVVMLIGNKVDKPDKVITYDMGAEYAREKGWGFMEVSAKADINVKTAFSNLVSNIFQVVTKTSGGEVPNNQLAVGDPRAASISLHGQNNAVGKNQGGAASGSGSKSGKKKNSSGCCK